MTEPAIIAQLAIPTGGTESVLLAVSGNMKARVQGLTFCNTAASPASFRLSFSKLGAPTALKDYVYYDLPMTSNNTFLSELDFTMDGTDVLRVYSGTGHVSVTLYGKLT